MRILDRLVNSGSTFRERMQASRRQEHNISVLLRNEVVFDSKEREEEVGLAESEFQRQLSLARQHLVTINAAPYLSDTFATSIYRSASKFNPENLRAHPSSRVYIKWDLESYKSRDGLTTYSSYKIVGIDATPEGVITGYSNMDRRKGKSTSSVDEMIADPKIIDKMIENAYRHPYTFKHQSHDYSRTLGPHNKMGY